jgi:hypothetical protein
MVCLLLIACSLDGSHGQTEPPKLKPFWAIRLPEGSQVLPVPGRDACYGAVAREMARAKEDCARRGIAELVIHGPPWEIKGPALGKLFPNHRFFVFVWSQRAKEPLPPNTPRPVGLLVAAHTSIAIDKGGLVDKLGHDGCIELSADFLAKNRVKVRNGDDAKGRSKRCRIISGAWASRRPTGAGRTRRSG